MSKQTAIAATVTTYQQAGEPRTDVDTCDVCCRHARRGVKIRDDEGREFYAADRCATLLLGYNPFRKGTQ